MTNICPVIVFVTKIIFVNQWLVLCFLYSSLIIICYESYLSIFGFCVFFIFIDDKCFSIVYNWLLSGLTYLIVNCGFNIS